MANTREVFEIAFQLSSRQAWRTKDGTGYQNPDIQARWEGWQARERLTAAPVQTPEQMAHMVETAPAPTADALLPYLRQYRHNDGSDGFVFAYEKEGTDRLVAHLTATLRRLADLADGFNVSGVYFSEDKDNLFALNAAFLAAAAPGAVPDGWKLVPIEPTEAMRDAAEKTVPQVFSMGDEYRAMVAAAPVAAAAPGSESQKPPAGGS